MSDAFAQFAQTRYFGVKPVGRIVGNPPTEIETAWASAHGSNGHHSSTRAISARQLHSLMMFPDSARRDTRTRL